MPSADPSSRALISRIAAHEKWAGTADRTSATAAARKAFGDRFVKEARELHPKAPEADVVAAAAQLRKAYYLRLALKSAEARRAKRRAA